MRSVNVSKSTVTVVSILVAILIFFAFPAGKFGGQHGLLMPEWIPSAFLSISAGASILAIFDAIVTYKENLRQAKRLANAQRTVDEKPQLARPAWELAVVQMEGYFSRNLVQVKAIFWSAVIAMFAGFFVMIYGTWHAFNEPDRLNVTIVSAAAGLVTEFIGATFMLLYRSTLRESSGFMKILERINLVGMAVQILDVIPETELKEKTAVRSEMVRILMESVHVKPELLSVSQKKKAEAADA